MRRAVGTVVLKRAGRERESGERERERAANERKTPRRASEEGTPPPLPRRSQSTYVTASLLADIATSLAGTSPPPPENAIHR